MDQDLLNILLSRRGGEQTITIGDLQGENAFLMPSNLLENVVVRLRPSMLRNYADCVIQVDYKGIIDWGICRGPNARAECMAVVFEVLFGWHSRLQEQDVCGAFEKELLSQLKEKGYEPRVREHTVQRFPHLKHDMIHIDLVLYSQQWFCTDPSNCGRQHFRQNLMTEYEIGEEEDGPSLAIVVLRSFLKSMEMSKYGREGLFDKEDLKNLLHWLSALKIIDKDSFCKDRPTMLLLLLQHVKLEASQHVETQQIKFRGELFGQPWFVVCLPWRMILVLLTNGGKTLQRKDWHHQQLPLHMLLSRGLPGQDILANQDIRTNDEDGNELETIKMVGRMCPIEGLYPFQLAAKARDYGEGFASVSEDTRRMLDQEHLSQVYSLIRASPSSAIEFHQSLVSDRAYVEAERDTGKRSARPESWRRNLRQKESGSRNSVSRLIGCQSSKSSATTDVIDS